MATKAPRPGKNSDGQAKQPSYTHSISIEPGKPQPPAAPPPPPGAPQPGATNPLTHPAHPAMQSSLGAGGPQKTSAVYPVQDQNPSGDPAGKITPTPTQDMRQVRENIQFKDMSPPEQAQVASQQGLDPYAPLKMVQQGVVGALGAGASSGPIPNELAGPYVPPGLESFPDDFAHLSTLMKQGYAPGASNQEHEFAQNAHAMARARIDAAMSQAQNGVGAEQAQPYAPSMPDQGGAPQGVGFAPGIPEGAPQPGGAPAPQLGSAMQSPTAPPMGAMPPGAGAPPGPPGPPPALIAALLSRARGKRQGAVR